MLAILKDVLEHLPIHVENNHKLNQLGVLSHSSFILVSSGITRPFYLRNQVFQRIGELNFLQIFPTTETKNAHFS